MSWRRWADGLRQSPQEAVADLLRGAADVGTFARTTPHDFLLAVLPRNSRLVSHPLFGEPDTVEAETTADADLPAKLDEGLAAWLLAQRGTLPPARKLGAYSADVCEALQWPLYFALPQTRNVLQLERAQWLPWLASLALSAYRDPEYDYWQALAVRQSDDSLQFFWHTFIVEAGRLRSLRYLNLGLLALARLPLSVDDSLHNLRLQVQALAERYRRRRGWGNVALEEFGETLRGVIARNPSMSADNYRTFLAATLAPLGDDKIASILSLAGLSMRAYYSGTIPSAAYRLKPPGQTEETDRAVEAVRRSGSLSQAWQAVQQLLAAHEDYLRKSGYAYYFVRNLDRCARALCEKYSLRDAEIQGRLFQWIHLALRIDADDPRLWMLWELALRQAGQPLRAKWVLWEMTRRFPDQLPCRVELARLLAGAGTPAETDQAQHLLERVLQLDPDHLHAHSTLAQLAIRRGDWPQALAHAQRGLRIDPSDQVSILLLAAAYARRNGPDDLQTAIEELRRFVGKYKGSLRAEDYLRKLVQRQQTAAQGQGRPIEDDDAASSDAVLPEETDAAWLNFANSVNAGVAGADAPADAERTLPLPRALAQAVAQGRWDSDVIDAYDTSSRRDFPLETRLWRYLQTVQSADATAADLARAREAVEAGLDAEKSAPQYGSPSWQTYLDQSWQATQAAGDEGRAAGSAWLLDLLDRHRPLPAPLLAA